MLRLGHYAYYSLTTLERMLARVGFRLRTAWTFDLYGGTVLLAATRDGSSDDSVLRILDEERELGITRPEYVGQLQDSAYASARGNSPRYKMASSTFPDFGGRPSSRLSSSAHRSMRARSWFGCIRPSMKVT